MPVYQISTSELWPHKVSYEVDAESVLDAIDMICNGDAEYDTQCMEEVTEKCIDQIYGITVINEDDEETIDPNDFQPTTAAMILAEVTTKLENLLYVTELNLDEMEPETAHAIAKAREAVLKAQNWLS